ncbi:MAG: fatty acid desaturase [Elusimicrobia bacterium]|nr:fatty acid desaturase [Elusimicrobiota bacterium]
MNERKKTGADIGSDRRGALALARDWGAIVLIAWASERIGGWPVYIAAAWLIGAFQFAIGEALLHEASHFHLFRTRAWNDRFEALYALPFLMTLSQFRDEHLAHHRDAGTPRDGLLADYRLIGLFEPNPDMFWLWFVKPVTGFAGYFYLTKLSLKPFRCGAKLVAFWTAVAAAAWALGGLRLLALYWVVPLFWCHVSYLYWSEVQDHFGTKSGTRTVVGALNNRLFHNNGYHAVHHARAWVPFYRLPEAHAAFVAGDGADAARDLSSGFLETYRQLRDSVAAAPAAPASVDVLSSAAGSH